MQKLIFLCCYFHMQYLTFFFLVLVLVKETQHKAIKTQFWNSVTIAYTLSMLCS